MRKFVLSLAAAGAALAFATPAAAQYYPQPPQPYGYNGYGYNGYGYNGFGQVRALQARINAVENQIRRLDRRDMIRDKRADRLKDEANNIERRLRRAARYGLDPREANDIQARIARLEQRVQYAVGNGYGRGHSYGYDRRDHWDRDDD
ncbi:MAG TPA: hypothetical protein VFK19_13475 [Sphingomicrobium sp.]|nr:hypothetical protein [Sphingomicrobium sp.]